MNVQLAAGAINPQSVPLLLIPLQGRNEYNITINGSKIDIVFTPHIEIQQPVENQPKGTKAISREPAPEETPASTRKRSASQPLPCSAPFIQIKRARSGLQQLENGLADGNCETGVYSRREKDTPSESRIHERADSSSRTGLMQLDVEHGSAREAPLHGFIPHVPGPASNISQPCASTTTEPETPLPQLSSSITEPETPSVHPVPSPIPRVSPISPWSTPRSGGFLSTHESSPAVSIRPPNCETPSDHLPGAQVVSSCGTSPLPFSSPLLQLQPRTLSPPFTSAAATPSP
ncbi:hypothetical protein BC835DRAFT_1422452 [Cytidiella melzeri]|nr:hypothetical protein BC835DRAFT_1422452 [Cytidiella melzeri]